MLDAWISYVNNTIRKQKYFELPNKNQLEQYTQKKSVGRKRILPEETEEELITFLFLMC